MRLQYANVLFYQTSSHPLLKGEGVCGFAVVALLKKEPAASFIESHNGLNDGQVLSLDAISQLTDRIGLPLRVFGQARKRGLTRS